MNAIFFWEKSGGLTLAHKCNPYGPLLSLSMKKQGIQLELGDYAFEKEELENKRETTEVLHINWLHHFYRADDLQTAVKRLHHFVENLHVARALNYRIIWTMHNFYPPRTPLSRTRPPRTINPVSFGQPCHCPLQIFRRPRSQTLLSHRKLTRHSTRQLHRRLSQYPIKS